MLPPLTSKLDVREERRSVFPENCAWIPFSELPSRLSELPPPNEKIFIYNSGEDLSEAVEFLKRGGREVEICSIEATTGTPRDSRMWSPNSFLETVAPSLTPGRALDLGCGAGRESIYLAANGWVVLAVDCLADAIVRLETMAERYGVGERITGQIGEAREGRFLEGVELAVSFFAMDPSILVILNEKLPVSATLIIETFTSIHQARFGKPSSQRTISSEMVARLLPNLRIIEYDESWRESGRHTGRLVATRDT